MAMPMLLLGAVVVVATENRIVPAHVGFSGRFQKSSFEIHAALDNDVKLMTLPID